MALPIETFDNRRGGFNYFRALGHPLCRQAAADIVSRIRSAPGPVAVYDPGRQLPACSALHGLTQDDYSRFYSQDTMTVGASVMGHEVRPITELPESKTRLLFAPVFDEAEIMKTIGHLMPTGCQLLTLQSMRLPERLLTFPRDYLHPMNFVTNFAFFRDQDGSHTRITTSNYWGGYGARDVFLWCRLYDADGAVLVDFEQPLGAAGSAVIIDSAEMRAAHKLPAFCGQLFLSVINGAGHNILKYVIDTYSDDGGISCTHDANPWPADLYAGLPAPADDERVILWVQNSHPAPISDGTIGLNRMGDDTVHYLSGTVAPFATRAVDITEELPGVRWPDQVEIHAGKWFIRPRYEVIRSSGRRCINHVNVERSDLRHDENIRQVAPWIGKGFILSAPVLPPERYSSMCLPTPMATHQSNLPVVVTCYDADGTEVACHRLGALPRRHSTALELSDQADYPGGYGHVELTYDLDAPDGVLDGWLHSLFRYTDKQSGHNADTSFGSHLYNHPMTFRNEPQSYKGPPPGLSTRLYLRLRPAPLEILCHLIYPVSQQWHEQSDTQLILISADGDEVAEQTVRIPANGSLLFSCRDVYSAKELKAAGNGQVLVRDLSCRLFGYQITRLSDSFALDHMFGF